MTENFAAMPFVQNDFEYLRLKNISSPPLREVPAMSYGTVVLSDIHGFIKFPTTCTAGTSILYVPDAIVAINGFRVTVIVSPDYIGGLEIQYSPARTMKFKVYPSEALLADVFVEIVCANNEMGIISDSTIVQSVI